MTTRRSRLEGCASDFTFDRRLGGELHPDEEARMEEHLERCSRCRGVLELLRAERDGFAREAPLEARRLDGANERVEPGDARRFVYTARDAR
jgi:anti-sigma factor RsiW